MANYVKFLRGTVTAYNNLANKDKDTLYFITENKDSTTGKLYLGSVELSGSINESGIADYLSELKDVDTAGAVQNNILGFNGTKWVPMDVNALVQVSVMGGANADVAGTAGLVPAPAAGEENYFLRGDGLWAPITKHSVQIFEIELNENEAHEDAIVRAVGEAIPVVGDFVIIKNANERISYIYNGIAWIALNNEYLTYINELQESINDITDVLTGDNGLQNQIDNLQSKLTQDIENLNTAVENKADEADLETLRETLENKAEKSELDNKANVNDIYTKQEVNTAIATAVSAADHLKRKIVNEYADIQKYIEEHTDADQYIFMVPTIYQYMSESNKYDEYIVLKSDNDTYTIEPVGSWSVNLEDYYNKTEINEKFVAKEDGKGLVNNTDIEKLSSIPATAEENYIKNVNEEQFAVSDVGELSLTPAITNALLTESDKAKLNALILGENDNIEISGKVNAFNVEELNVWIEQNRNNINGLLSVDAQAKIDNIVDPIIYSVNPNEFTLTESKQLNLASVPLNKVENLADLLNAKDNAIETLDTKVLNIEEALNNYVLKDSLDDQLALINTDLSTLKQAMQWGTLVE